MAFTPPEVVVEFTPAAARYADGLQIESTIGGRSETNARAQVVVRVTPAFGFRFSAPFEVSPNPSGSTENQGPGTAYSRNFTAHWDCGDNYRGLESYRECPTTVRVKVSLNYVSNGLIIRWTDNGPNTGKIMTAANSDTIVYR